MTTPRRPRPLPRLVRRAAFVLALAAASTLLLAWALPLGLVRWGRFAAVSTSPDTFWTDGVRGGHYVHHRHSLFEWIDFRRIIFVGAPEDLAYYNQNQPPHWAAVVSLDMREGFEQVVTGAFGWPRRCFRVETWHSWREPAPEAPPLLLDLLGTAPPKPARPPPPYEVRRGVLIRDAAMPAQRLILPLRPMWPGLVADAAFFALAWALLLYVPGGVRRRLRSRRGRCVRCGYPRAGLGLDAPCPECGTIARRAAAHPGGVV